METYIKNKLYEKFMLNQGKIISLDSRIEEIFYKKCIAESSATVLILEWANSKEVYCAHTKMIANTYGNYSKHDRTHSVAILSAILSVIGENKIEKLSIMDLWLLLHCAYAHDIGMPYSYKEAQTLWNNIKKDSGFGAYIKECLESDDQDIRKAASFIDSISEKLDPELSVKTNSRMEDEKFSYDWVVKASRYYTYLTAEYCRKNHADRSEKFLAEQTDLTIGKSFFAIEPRFYALVARCSKLHGENFDKVLELAKNKKEWSVHGDCHPAFITALLRLGDLLDLDNNRFDVVLLKYYGDLPKISELHKKKHESIYHINYSKDSIEVFSSSNDEEVCKCASEWFFYLDKEVKDIIFNWKKIAPENLGGCELSVPNTKVYFNNQLYSSVKNSSFRVNSDMLIDLVIGRNLYYSRFDFIKEYLQNSLDAVKMKFWIDLVDDAHAYLIKDSYQEQWRKIDKKDVTPFFFNKVAFERLPIEVNLKWIKENGEKPKIRINISDKGIGIDKECLESISNIGSGWGGRKKYRKYLSNMPAWLKPTGGFGIGMQSGFMISDKVEIDTKCEDELDGRHIILHSAQKSGYIEEQILEKKRSGTSISVDVPYEFFLDEKNFEKYKLINCKLDGDYFDKNTIMKIAESFLYEYLKTIAGDTLFPILLRKENSVAKKLEGIAKILEQEIDDHKSISLDKDSYEIYRYANQFYIWNDSKSIWVHIDSTTSFADAKLEWYYKGIKVWNKISSSEEYLVKAIGNIEIDIMGLEVKKCLTIDRNKFMEKFNYHQLLENIVKIYYKYCPIIEDKVLPISSLTAKDIYKLFVKFLYSEDSKTKSLISQYLMDSDAVLANSELILDALTCEESGAESQNFVTTTTPENGDGKMITMATQGKGTNLAYEYDVITLPEIVYQIMEGKNISENLILNLNNNVARTYEKVINDKSLNKILQENNIKKVIFSTELYNLLLNYPHERLNLSDVFLSEGVIVRRVSNEDDEQKEKVFENAFSDSKSRQVFFTSKFYPQLYISALPMGIFKKTTNDSNAVKNMIISPISAMNSNKELIKARVEEKENSSAEFRKIIEDDSFEYLLNWVYDYQIEPHKYSKEEIRKTYGELIDYIFNVNKLE